MDVPFELPELVGVDPKASSCFRRLEVEEHLSLLPSYIGRVGEGVTEHLNRRVMRYSESYSGVLLSYSKPAVLQTAGLIMDEQPHMHFDIRYFAFTFKPVTGSILCGQVSKVGREHIGCLVYQCFNASVTQRRSSKGKRNGLWTNMNGCQWDIGDEIWFRVIELEVLDGVLSIRGEHVRMEDAGGESQETGKKHKKYKKHRHSDLEEGLKGTREELCHRKEPETNNVDRKHREKRAKEREKVSEGKLSQSGRKRKRKDECIADGASPRKKVRRKES